MTRKPEFYILAGPNGAGKTTSGHLFVPTSISIFNGDQVLADLMKKHPTIEPARLHGGVAKSLEDARDAALSSKMDFAFETNYSSDMATELAQQFKKAGYRTILIYFGLDSLKISGTRVRERKLSGGHDVTPEVMAYNFNEGIKRVNKDLKLYDIHLFIDTQNQNTRVIALLHPGMDKPVVLAEDVNWYDQHFRKNLEALVIRRKRPPQRIRKGPDKPGKHLRP